MIPNKAVYMTTDLKRLREYYQVPLNFPKVWTTLFMAIVWHYDNNFCSYFTCSSSRSKSFNVLLNALPKSVDLFLESTDFQQFLLRITQ